MLMQAELARLRKSMAEREEQRQAHLLQERIAKSLSGAESSNSHAAQAEDQVKRTLKVAPPSANALDAMMTVWVTLEGSRHFQLFSFTVS